MNTNIFQTHSGIKIEASSIGQENQPLIVVDNFIADPQLLVEYAAQNTTLNQTKDYYPGVRTNMPDAYLNLIEASLGETIYKTFKLNPNDICGAEAFFSIVETPPEKLHPLQRIPHFDGSNPNDIAFLHYLCDERFGGTSFYRHKSTGHEYVNKARYEPYLKTLSNEIESEGLPEPPRYMNGNTELFERFKSIPAVFNRLLIYRGTSLHSGDIASNYEFDTNPLTGRLTATSFLYSAN